MDSKSFHSFALLLGLIASASAAEFPKQIIPGVQQIARIQAPAIRESSGLVASRQFTNVFWTHNDHGSAQVLYAIAPDGSLIDQFEVVGNRLVDWEDIANDDKGNLFIADTGNNDARRDTLAVYRIAEPKPNAENKTVTITHSWTLRFPGKPFDCESLFIFGTNGYVFSKVFHDERATLYRFPLSDVGNSLLLKLVAETQITSPVTGADISSDGKLLGVVAKSGAFVYEINGDVTRVGSVQPFRVKFKDHHVEACAFVPEGLMATAEPEKFISSTMRLFVSALNNLLACGAY